MLGRLLSQVRAYSSVKLCLFNNNTCNTCLTLDGNCLVKDNCYMLLRSTIRLWSRYTHLYFSVAAWGREASPAEPWLYWSGFKKSGRSASHSLIARKRKDRVGIAHPFSPRSRNYFEDVTSLHKKRVPHFGIIWGSVGIPFERLLIIKDRKIFF